MDWTAVICTVITAGATVAVAYAQRPARRRRGDTIDLRGERQNNEATNGGEEHSTEDQ